MRPRTVRWWKAGDHPQVTGATGTEDLCRACGAAHSIHGLIEGQLVHPGDHVSVNRLKGDYLVIHPDPFEETP